MSLMLICVSVAIVILFILIVVVNYELCKVRKTLEQAIKDYSSDLKSVDSDSRK